ncbi:MAG: M56 family metallopeptidase [Fusicatenibacter sp.]|nr:M56 family metallopeptidase [Fusicatenibacter sp.]
MNRLFLQIVNMSIAAGWLVLAVLLLRMILRKAPRWVNVLLWGIVALRLLCPFSMESALSLIPSAETIPLNVEWAAEPAIDSGINAINGIVNPVLSGSFAPNPVASINPLQIWIPVFSILWLIGSAVMLLYTAISYFRLRRKIDTAVRYRDNIFQSENVVSPFVLGIIRPRIYLPFELDGQDLEHVIAHEQAHICRKDHWWKPIGFLLLTVYWFHPLLWLAYLFLCRDIELACDEKVIKNLDNQQRAEYTQALVACSVSRRRVAACPLAFGEVGVKERVKSVMNYKKPAFWFVAFSVILCGVVAVCFLTDPKQEDFELSFVIPAGSQESVIYSDTEISPTKNQIIIQTGKNLGDTEVSLLPVKADQESAVEQSAYLTPGLQVKMKAEKGEWFKIGISVQNPADEDLVVSVNVKNVEVRISDQTASPNAVFRAEILEIHDGYFGVRPLEGSMELNSADQIEVPIQQMQSSPEPQVGDVIEIEYSGEILETYPARLQEVYRIRVVSEEEKQDLLPQEASIIAVYEVTEPDLVDEYWENNQLVTMVKYYEMSDGTWKTDDFTYQYRLEITGRMANAEKDSTYVFLSNIEDISFEQAWKASGLSSSMADYFKEEDAKLVAMK